METAVDAIESAQCRPRRDLRVWAMAFVLLGHVAALVAFASGQWLPALALLLPAGAILVWGSLYPHSRLFGPVCTRLATSQSVVWLSFDDGPGDETAALLDTLDRHDARATFFLVGERARQRPELVRAIVERGHDIGNHSASHPAARFWALSPAGFRHEVETAQAQLTALAGRAPRWFRAVAGLGNPGLAPVLRRAGLQRVSWTARGFDTVDDDDDRVLRRLLRGLRPGAILLLHEGVAPGRGVRLLERLLTSLSARGYGTVLPGDDGSATTSQLLNGVRPHNGRKRDVSPSADNSAVSDSRVG